MRAYEFLLEAKIDDYINQEQQIATTHDPSAKYQEPADIIKYFHQYNPTGDVNQTRWIISQYKKGQIKQEDAPGMKELLTQFNKYKDKLPLKQIAQYKTQGDLRTALQPFLGTSKSDKQEIERQKSLEGADLVYHSPNIDFWHVHTEEASKELGKGLPWCTSRRDCRNMFNHYNEKSGGRFYIAQLHNEEFPYRRIGIALGVNEFQDENNENIATDVDTLDALVARNPELKQIKQLQTDDFKLMPLRNFANDTERQLFYINAVIGSKVGMGRVPTRLRTPEFYREIVSKKEDYDLSGALGDVPKEFRTPELCEIAVRKYGRALQYVPKKLRTPELCKIAVSNDAFALQYVPIDELSSEDYFEICKIAVSVNSIAIEVIPDELKHKVWTAVNQKAESTDITRLKQLIGRV